MSSKPRLIVHPNKLRALRLTALLTQEQLAAKADLHEATVKKFEGSVALQVSTRTVQKLAEALDCDPARFSEVLLEEAAS